MSDDDARREMARKTIVLDVPGMAEARVRRALPYGAPDATSTFDLYLPPAPAPGAAPPPLVVFVYGFTHPMFAGGLRETGAYTSWGRLLAASGLAAVAYSYKDPLADLATLLAHLRTHAHALGVDARRIALWAASGNVPAALATILRAPVGSFRAAALLYGYAFGAQQAAAAFGIVTADDKSVADLPAQLPILVVRAGADATPGLNASLDAFVAGARARGLPLELLEVPDAPHAFDLVDDREASREAIRKVVGFLERSLGQATRTS
jgi:acetyl esterase/lipase